jgi:hypothetical protein
MIITGHSNKKIKAPKAFRSVNHRHTWRILIEGEVGRSRISLTNLIKYFQSCVKRPLAFAASI